MKIFEHGADSSVMNIFSPEQLGPRRKNDTRAIGPPLPVAPTYRGGHGRLYLSSFYPIEARGLYTFSQRHYIPKTVLLLNNCAACVSLRISVAIITLP